MERVETLLQKLQEQFKEGASADQLLLTVQMLQHELTHVQSRQPAGVMGSVVVSMPLQPIVNKTSVGVETRNTPPVEEEKTVEVLQVDEAEVEAELEEIKNNAAVMQQLK